MNYQQSGSFVPESYFTQVLEAVKERLGDGYDVSLTTVTKNNHVTCRGLLIKTPDTNLSPNIYIDDMYTSYSEGMITLDGIVDTVMETLENSNLEIDEIDLCNPDSIRDRIFYRLVSFSRNEEALETMPHIRIHDLAVIFCLLATSGDNGIGSVKIDNRLMELTGFDLNRLLSLAVLNTPKLFPPVFKNIFEVLSHCVPPGCDDFFDLPECPFDKDEHDNYMYVLSNTTSTGGAAVLLYPGIAEEIRRKLGSGFFVIPSSVHELIIVPDSFGEKNALEEMVLQVNSTCVKPSDILSDKVYHYPEDEFTLPVPLSGLSAGAFGQ